MSILILMAIVFFAGMASEDSGFGCAVMMILVLGLAMIAGGA